MSTQPSSTLPASTDISTLAPSLPKGGGAIQGVVSSHGPAGPSGTASLSVTLPVSAGRGYAPPLTLSYSSAGDNGPFGIGWQVPVMTIRRRTSHGVPHYDASDTFIGPDGEVLVPALDGSGQPVVTNNVTDYNGVKLNATYSVACYCPRVEGAFDRIEYWQPTGGTGTDFWLVHGADGQLHLLGKTTCARIADPADRSTRTAVWLVEESVSPSGEHIGYTYVSDAGLALPTLIDANRDAHANRYLCAVYYGNVTAAADLFLWAGDTGLTDLAWLFTLIFDYGARGIDRATPPPFTPAAGSLDHLRSDPFSSYAFGFEVRTRVLCQQVLMFHDIGTLSGQDANQALVSRLLFEYDDNPAMSELIAAHPLAYEPDDNTLQALPPTEWQYTQMQLSDAPAVSWQAFSPLPGLDDGVRFQLIDLYGEGLPGILARYPSGWYYRAPIRDTASPDPDAVTYAPDWQLLPSLPATNQDTRAMLTDINGDGQLDWVITQPGLAGFFTLHPDRAWSNFIPFGAFPPEYANPQAQLADIVGAGLPDLVLIGPKSVRLYANHRAAGFGVPQDVPQSDGITLPTRGRDATELVAFSDVLGSGQSHLVSVRHDGLTCWPNLGRGRFDTPLTMAFPTPFDAYTFDPKRVYLADLDGSGTADVLYADTTQLVIWRNLAGNRFASEPMTLPYPDGRTFDQLSAIHVADVQGQGMASLVLSVPYSGANQAPQHWYYRLADHKPYLLNRIDNNLGAVTRFQYRSSAQVWLDEKQELSAAGQPAVCALPFPMHLMVGTSSEDQLTGNRLQQTYLYRQGVYDGHEREFRGFGYVETQDCPYDQDVDATGSTGSSAFSPPLLTCTWYHTGRQDDEVNLYARPRASGWVTPYTGDAQAFPVSPTQFTQFTSATASVSGHDIPFTPDNATAWWLYRSLKGSVLRSEVYGRDDSAAQDTPYTVSTISYQVRCVQAGVKPALGTSPTNSQAPVALPGRLEQWGYTYERNPADPVITQQLVTVRDTYGATCQSFTAYYPRRARQADPYTPPLTPDTLWSNSYDAQQNMLRLTEQRQSWFHLDHPTQWRLALPNQSRTEFWCFDGSIVGTDYPNGLTPADLQNDGPLLSQTQASTFGGQTVTCYLNQGVLASTPDFVALVDHTETAQLDTASLQAYDGILSEPARIELLHKGGYQLREQVLPASGQPSASVWCALHGYTTYGDATQFYRPVQQWHTALTQPGLAVGWDRGYCGVVSTQDAYDNTTQATYDYRFLTPCRLIDINANVHEVQYDALGRVVATSVYGTQLQGSPAVATPVGFDSVQPTPAPGWSTWPSTPRAAHLSVEAAIEQGLSDTRQPQASIVAYAPFSWMGQLSTEALNSPLGQQLLTQRYVTPEGYVRARMWQAYAQADALPAQAQVWLAAVLRLPVHSASRLADAYPGASAQQIQITVAYYDGFGRALQSCAHVPDGQAWHRLDDGSLGTTDNGELTPVDASPRWAVSGRVEYDDKGLIIRQYQPYFVDSWRYVADTAMRADGYADTHYYDALGREIKVVTALGWQRWAACYPWFSVAWDENDTWQTVLQQQAGEIT